VWRDSLASRAGHVTGCCAWWTASPGAKCAIHIALLARSPSFKLLHRVAPKSQPIYLTVYVLTMLDTICVIFSVDILAPFCPAFVDFNEIYCAK